MKITSIDFAGFKNGKCWWIASKFEGRGAERQNAKTVYEMMKKGFEVREMPVAEASAAHLAAISGLTESRPMDAKELATKLNGCEYRHEIDCVTEASAKMNGLVVVFGGSDDLMEFCGYLNDEIGASKVQVDREGILPEWEEIEDSDRRDIDFMRDFFRREGGGKSLESVWDNEGYSWTYKTDIPHYCFDVMEDGDKYCRGIVFRISDL